MTGDGRTGEASETVRADPALLWAMVTDVTRMGEWSPENQGGEWLDGADGAVVGAHFKGHNRRGKATWSTTCEVVEAEPGRIFAFRTSGSPNTVWRYRFEPVDGGTHVTESFEMAKPLGTFSRLLTRVTTGVTDRRSDMEEGARTTLARLKAVAEAAG